MNGGALATAGNLVFHGSGDGALAAYRANDGVKLWEAVIGIAVMAPPISYRVNGEQYVAVSVGMGGSAGLNMTEFDYQNAGYVIAWKLGGKASLPAVEKRPAGVVQVEPTSASPGAHRRGAGALLAALLPLPRHGHQERRRAARPALLLARDARTLERHRARRDSRRPRHGELCRRDRAGRRRGDPGLRDRAGVPRADPPRARGALALRAGRVSAGEWVAD